MKQRDWLFWLLVIISVATILSGVIQLALPWFILSLVGGPMRSDVYYFFGIIGMFMAIFGGLLLQVLFDVFDHPIALLWAAAQKLGAAVAVSAGVATHMFSPLALALASFDCVSGILILVYRRRATMFGAGG